jgi:cytochrome c553
VKKLSRVVLGLAVLALVLGPVVAADLSIKDVMKKAHAGMESLLAGVEKQVKGNSPDWESVQKSTKELSELGQALAKNDPPQGGKESWEKQCKIYSDQVAALDVAAGKKDLKSTADAAAKIRMSCGACHGPHKPKK